MNNLVKSFMAIMLATVSLSCAICLTGCKLGKEEKADFFPTVTIAQANGEVEYTPVIDGNPQKITLPLLSGDIYTVSKNYQQCITDNYNPNYEDCFAPTPLVVSWTSEETPLYYTFDISTNKNMSNPESYITTENTITLKYLFMGYDYYYRISAKFEDKLIKSRIFEFSTEYLPRTVFIDQKVSNTRDWGGYLTSDGKRVKQGIVYRGGEIENITEQGKSIMLTDLGIVTDLDVRGDGATQKTQSPLGKDVNYIEVKGPYYVGRYGQGIDLESYQAGLAMAIRTFANADNFPVYVHCSLGRDRTGTLCFLIQALLGVGEKDIFRDYELSMMARTGKDINNPNSQASYMVRFPFQALYDYVKNLDAGKTLQENAETFIRSLGITKAEIKAIKKNMLAEG